MKKIQIYSDGWARPNPGPWGYWVILKYNWKVKEISWFEENTTNNRMELTWAIKWLETLKEPCEVEIFTDSSYVVNWIEKGWAIKWRANNWMRTKTEKALNYDLWNDLLNLTQKHKIQFNWVKWHAGHTENERCDALATAEILKNTSVGNDCIVPKYQIKKEDLSNNELIKLVLNTWNDNSSKNIKITKEWQNCRKCWTPVIKAIPKNSSKAKKSYYYKYYFNCPNCKTNYFVDDAKVML